MSHISILLLTCHNKESDTEPEGVGILESFFYAGIANSSLTVNSTSTPHKLKLIYLQHNFLLARSQNTLAVTSKPSYMRSVVEENLEWSYLIRGNILRFPGIIVKYHTFANLQKHMTHSQGFFPGCWKEPNQVKDLEAKNTSGNTLCHSLCQSFFSQEYPVIYWQGLPYIH